MVRVEPVGEAPVGEEWGAHRVTHKIVKKCVTLMLHNSESVHARAAKLHTNKD